LSPRGEPIEPETVESMLGACIRPRHRTRLDRDGSCVLMLDHRAHGRLRLTVSRTETGLAGAFRLLLDPAPTRATLSLPADLQRVHERAHGIILVASAANQGKTTTAAALLDALAAARAAHVVTIEDPVEYVVAPQKAMLRQREVGPHAPTIAAGVASAIRAD